MQDNSISRRTLLAGLGASTLGLNACSNGFSSGGGAKIDARADATLRYLTSTYPASTELMRKSVGQLIMPLVTEAGFGLGAAYGRGVLRVNESTVDYYMLTQASAGFQIGAQQYAHVLFFMTKESLEDFRYSTGWVASAEVKYAFKNDGDQLMADTITANSPIIAVIFGRTGLIAGATVEGAKYTRVIP